MAEGDIIMGMVSGGIPFFPCGPCSPPPGECCMYPEEFVQSGDTTLSDLPNELDITLDGVLYAGATKFDFGAGHIGYKHPDYDGGLSQLLGHFDGGGGWVFGDDGGMGGGLCLIMEVDLGVTKSEDLFPDTLIMSFAGYDTPVYRVSRCVWQGLDICGNLWKTWFGDIPVDGGIDYKWSAKAYQFDHGEGVNCPGTEAFAPSQKTGFQNTPIGNYDEGTGNITVSE